jgi:hypothetical protein
MLSELQKTANKEQFQSLRVTMDQERLVSHLNKFDVAVSDAICKPQQIIAWAKRQEMREKCLTKGDEHKFSLIEPVFGMQLQQFLHVLLKSTSVSFLPYLITDADSMLSSNVAFRNVTSVLGKVLSVESEEDTIKILTDILQPDHTGTKCALFLQAWVNRLQSQIKLCLQPVHAVDDYIAQVIQKISADEWDITKQTSQQDPDLQLRILSARPKRWCKECATNLSSSRISCSCHKYARQWHILESILWCQHLYDMISNNADIASFMKHIMHKMVTCSLSEIMQVASLEWSRLSKKSQWIVMLLLLEFLVIHMESLCSLVAETGLVVSSAVRSHFTGLCRVVLQNATLWVRDRQNQPPTSEDAVKSEHTKFQVVEATATSTTIASRTPVQPIVPKMMSFSPLIPTK